MKRHRWIPWYLALFGCITLVVVGAVLGNNLSIEIAGGAAFFYCHRRFTSAYWDEEGN